MKNRKYRGKCIIAFMLTVIMVSSILVVGFPVSAEPFTPAYVAAYDGTPSATGVGYTAAEVSAHASQLIAGQRVRVTAHFDGFQIYLANWNTYHFTLSVYQWTDDYATTIAATPLKTTSRTMTHGNVQPESFVWNDGDLDAGEYLFVVENPSDRNNDAARLGVAGVKSNVSKGEFYRLGEVVSDTELGLDIHFTEAEPTGGYFAEFFVPTYVAAYDGTPAGNTYTPAEVSGKTPAEIISGQRVNVTAPFNGFQIYFANGNVYYFTLSVYKWTDDYATTIQTTPLKTKSATMTHGNVQPESLVWSDGALPAGDYFFVVEKTESKSSVTNNPNRLGLAEVASSVSKGEYYRVGTLTTGKELALDIRFTAPEPTGGYFAELFVPEYVHAYDGTPTGNTYTAAEVSGKTPAEIISGQRVKVTAPFDGFRIYFANGNVYYFTLSVYKWTDDYATTIQTTPLKTESRTMTHGNVQPESIEWSDGALPAGEYFFAVEKTESKLSVTNNPNRLGLAEVASSVSKGEYYRVGTLTAGKELALDIRFTAAEPAEGYFAEVEKTFSGGVYVPAYDGKPTGNTYTPGEVSGKTPAEIISGQRVNVTVPFDGFQIYFANGNVYYFTLSVYQWTDDYETTIQTTPLKTESRTLTHGAVQPESIEWSDGALPAGEYFFAVEKTESKSTVTNNPNRLGLGEVASTVSKGEYYRIGALVTGKELALDIRFTESEPAEGYFADVFADDFVPTYVPAYDGTPKGNTYTPAEVSGKTPDQIISGQRVKVTAPFDGFQIYFANGNVYYFTLSVYKWTDDFNTTIQATPLKTESRTLTHGAVQPESIVWSDGALPAGEYLFVVEKTESKTSVTTNPNRLGLGEVASDVSKGEYYRVGALTAGKELALDIRFTEIEPDEGYFADMAKRTYVPAYEVEAESKNIYSAEAGAEVGQRLIVNAPFSGFKFFVGRLKSTKAELSLYKWNRNYKTTVSARPLATKTCDLIFENGYVEFMMDETMPAGEYLFLFHNSDSAITWFGRATNKATGGYTYQFGAQQPMELNMQVCFDEQSSNPFSPVTTDLYVNAYDNTAEGTHLWTPEAGYIAKQVKINTGFSGVRYFVGRLESSELSFSVYAWNKTVDHTLEKKPIATKRAYITQENGWVEADFGKVIPAGEYLIAAENADSKFAIWGVKDTSTTHAPAFSNGNRSECDLSLSFFVLKNVDNMFGDVSSGAYVKAYEEKAEAKRIYSAEAGAEVGQRLVVNAPFSGFKFFVGRLKSTKAELSLYKWNRNYKTTVSAKPLATKTCNLVLENGYVELVVDEIVPAGEYLFLFHNSDSAITWFGRATNKATGGYTYQFGAQQPMELNMQVYFDEQPSNPFSPVTTDLYVNAYDNTAEGTHLWTPEGGYIAKQVRINTGFSGVRYFMGRLKSSELDFSVYTWNKTVDQTLAKKAIATKRAYITQENGWVEVDFGNVIPAGEYLIVAENADSRFAIWGVKDTSTTHAPAFSNGIQSQCDLSMSFFVAKKVDHMFGAISPEYVYTDVGMTDPNAYSSYMRINPMTKEIGQRLNINRNFDGIAFQLPTFWNTDCKVSISGYEWAGSYEATVAREPIKTVRVNTVRDNGWHWFFFDEEQGPGDYLFLLHDPVGYFAVYYSVGNEVSKGYCYIDGAEIRNTCNVRVRIPGNVDTRFRDVNTSTKVFRYEKNEDGEYNAHRTGFSLTESENKYGMRVKLERPIVGIEFALANMNLSERTVYYCVYDWKGDYDSSIAQKPIEKLEVKFGDTWNPIVMQHLEKPLSAGEYLILVESGPDVVHYFATSEKPNLDATFYLNGKEMSGSMWMGVVYAADSFDTPVDKAIGYADE